MRKPILFYHKFDQTTDLYKQLVKEKYLVNVTSGDEALSALEIVNTNIPIFMKDDFTAWSIEDKKRSVLVIKSFDKASEYWQKEIIDLQNEVTVVACIKVGTEISLDLKSQFISTDELKIVMKMIGHYKENY